jgi:hypothetical protein
MFTLLAVAVGAVGMPLLAERGATDSSMGRIEGERDTEEEGWCGLVPRSLKEKEGGRGDEERDEGPDNGLLCCCRSRYCCSCCAAVLSSLCFSCMANARTPRVVLKEG